MKKMIAIAAVMIGASAVTAPTAAFAECKYCCRIIIECGAR